MTRNGIEYNLYKSPYKAYFEDLTFIFSSKFYLDKFKEELEDFSHSLNMSLSNRFSFDFKLDQLWAILLYTKIEKRGFLLQYKGRYVSCLAQIHSILPKIEIEN